MTTWLIAALVWMACSAALMTVMAAGRRSRRVRRWLFGNPGGEVVPLRRASAPMLDAEPLRRAA